MENKFEKQIHRKLDELKISPSESVWLSVKDRIKHKKDRKWPVIILIFLIMGIPIGYLHFSSAPELSITSTKSAKTDTTESQPNVNNATGKNEDAAKRQTGQMPPGISDSKPGDKEKIDASPGSSSISGNFSVVRNPSNINRETKATAIKSQDVPIYKHEEENQFKEQLPATPNFEGEDNYQRKEFTSEEYREPDQSNIWIESRIYSHIIPAIKIDHAILYNSSSINQIKQLTLSDRAIAEIVKAQKVVTEKNAKKNWAVGIYAAGGIAHVGSRFLGLGTAPAADYLQSANSSANPGGGTVIPSPSKIRNEVGYAAGIFLEKEISKNSSISFGINFKELNTSNVTGRKNDSIPGGISFDSRSSNVSQEYRNSFRFLELPLQFNTQLVKGNKITLLWHGGFAISQLISSNALQFDPALKSYYNDNSIFNKTQLGFNTALSLSIIKQKNLAILAGPFIDYHLTRLTDEGLYAKKHFVFAGLQTRILFEKK